MHEVFQALRTEDILAACGAETFRRGRKYFTDGRVLSCDLDNRGFVVATVRGSYSQHYSQTILVTFNLLGDIEIRGHCTCPMNYNCKHVAAVLIEVTENIRRYGVVSTGAENAAGPGSTPAKDVLADWMEWARRRLLPENEVDYDDEYERSSNSALLYLLHPPEDSPLGCWHCVTARSRRLKKGGWGKPISYDATNLTEGYHAPPGWIEREDVLIANLIQMLTRLSGIYEISGDVGLVVLRRMMALGRCFYRQPDAPLTPGPERGVTPTWESDEADNICLRLHFDGVPDDRRLRVLPTEPAVWLDPERAELGLIRDMPAGAMLDVLQYMPPVSPERVAEVSLFLRGVTPASGLVLPLPEEVEARAAAVGPVPRLKLLRIKDADGDLEPLARPSFFYAPVECRPHPSMAGAGVPRRPERLLPVSGPGAVSSAESLVRQDGECWRVVRDEAAEAAWLHELHDCGLRNARNAGFAAAETYDLLFPGATPDIVVFAWMGFLDRLPELTARGWEIVVDDSFEMNFVPPDRIDVRLDDAGGGDWFDLGVDLEFEGRRIALLPLLVRWLESAGADVLAGAVPPSVGDMLIQVDNGHWLRCPARLLQPVYETLVELFDEPRLSATGALQLARTQVCRLAQLDDGLTSVGAGKPHWHGGEELRELAGKLANFSGIAVVEPPAGLDATLRDYQRRGLDWMNFLRDYGFNGILADDMGLGKTMQTLAHILREKEAGRLATPALVVAPTSVLGIWRREAERFAGGLRTVVLHGPKRNELMENGGLDDRDLLITSYALLHRDREYHAGRRYHLLILDEAQAIKNPAAKAARAAGLVPADQRLCLTGTPVENHLGELWSLFNFLMPGFLGTEKHFRHIFRRPIEQHGSDERRRALKERLRPFVMRREKAAVAAELPPKTVVIQPVELTGAQARLYETVRSAMSARVRELLAEKGLIHSRIEILDALLKLRQTCCDPRLVKLESARGVKGSAKLEALLEMVAQLVEEGRRILLFSQFTSMLQLIEAELKPRGIEWVKLTGQTRKRQEVIDAFQDGKVPLFLISLKAGGFGLNLTAADTVIHYDPWWNPAVESQATDRAHRIGQEKPVFVYKLIAANTVEERIVQLQEKKRLLADGVYGDDQEAELAALTADDLLGLLAG
ncbi:MAG: DEAD/DEAH box helicase [Deltaproteobacteria bacterium]|nr:DEAD/DEAH box helicase [Candidatus Anaeroferrophillacea bacterium]